MFSNYIEKSTNPPTKHAFQLKFSKHNTFFSRFPKVTFLSTCEVPYYNELDMGIIVHEIKNTQNHPYRKYTCNPTRN